MVRYYEEEKIIFVLYLQAVTVVFLFKLCVLFIVPCFLVLRNIISFTKLEGPCTGKMVPKVLTIRIETKLCAGKTEELFIVHTL